MSPTAKLITATLAVIAYAIWMRRDTFGSDIERPLTIAALLCFAGITLISPQAHPITGVGLHTLTGLWHLDVCLGDLCLITAQVFALYGFVGVLLDDIDRHTWMRAWINPMLTVAAPTMITCLLFSHAVTNPAPNILDIPVDGFLTGYWLITCTAQTYLWLAGLRVPTVIRRDRQSRLAARAYLAATITGISACALQAGSALTHATLFDHTKLITWTLLCTAYTGLCLTAGYSWCVKKHHLRGTPSLWCATTYRHHHTPDPTEQGTAE